MYEVVFSTNSFKKPPWSIKKRSRRSGEVIHRPYLPGIYISRYTTLVDVPTRGCLKKCVIIEYRPFGPIIIMLL